MTLNLSKPLCSSCCRGPVSQVLSQCPLDDVTCSEFSLDNPARFECWSDLLMWYLELGSETGVSIS